MKKVLIALSIVLSLSMVFTGCSKAPADTAKDSQPQTESTAQVDSKAEESNPTESKPTESKAEAAATIPEFSLAIEGVKDCTAFTSADAAKLKITELSTSVTNKNSETTVSVYTGVLLKDLLASIGVTDLKTLTIEASDGYQVKYEKDMALAEDVIVGWLLDGKAMENNQINISPAKAGGKTLAKMAVKLIVE